MLTKLEVHVTGQSVLEFPLTGAEAAMDQLQVRNITGIGPVSATVNTTPYGSVDGESYSGSTVAKRNIVITLGLNPNWIDDDFSSLRQTLYRYFMPKRRVVLRFFRDILPTCEIVGYVESCEPNIFSRDPEMQLSIICPLPDFVAITPTVVNGLVVISGGFVPFEYEGTVETGFILTVTSTEDNPSHTGWITVISVGEGVQVAIAGYGTVDATHNFVMSSVSGSKYLRMIASDQSYSNQLSTLIAPDGWPILKPGTNEVTVGALEAGQAWELTYFDRYGGL